jgi:hypothetical protein
MNNMIASEWREHTKNTLRGFFTLTLPSGIAIHGCQLHEKNGRRWVGLPARPYQKDGKTEYARILEFNSAGTHAVFQEQALAAVDALLGGEAA